jgi:hypothetical protein
LDLKGIEREAVDWGTVDLKGIQREAVDWVILALDRDK